MNFFRLCDEPKFHDIVNDLDKFRLRLESRSDLRGRFKKNCFENT